MSARSCLALLAACSACSGPEAEQAEREPARAALALAFDGVDDYATFGTAEFPLAEAAQSASLWLELSADDGEQAALVLRKDFDSGFVLGFRAGVLEVYSAYSGRSYVVAPAPFPLEQWHHVAYVFDGALHSLYLDGALLASGDYPPNNRTPTSAWLGSVDGRASFFHGKLDALRLWRAARGPEEIAEEAAGNLIGDRSLLVADLAFDESSGGRALDDSGLDNHGTLGDGDVARSPARVSSTH